MFGTNIAVIWNNAVHDSVNYYGDILFNISYDEGQTWGTDYPVDQTPSHSGCPRLAVSKGRIFAIWYDTGNLEDTNDGVYFSYWPYFAPEAVPDEQHNLPDNITLSAYPNPFNISTTLSLGWIEGAEIEIYDITGRRVDKLHMDKGTVVWDAASLSSGVYFARVVGEEISKSVKLVLLK
jgi:hypothetical protein